MSERNRITAALLAFFLGGLGIHKFYLGEKTAGILYLLFCWTGIPMILAFLDGIGYLMMSDEAFEARYGYNWVRPEAGRFVMPSVQQTIVSVPPPVAPPQTVVAPPPPAQRAHYAPGTKVSDHGIEKTRPLVEPSAPAAWLVAQGGSRHGQQFALKRGDTNIGRNGQQSDVVIEHTSVSGQHARVRYDNGKFWLYDLASTNGTYINNGRVSKQLLYDNDQVRLGDVTLVFKIVERRH